METVVEKVKKVQPMVPCGLCEKEFRGAGAVNLHRFKKHQMGGSGNPVAPVASKVEQTGKCRFFSAKAPQQLIIIRPPVWKEVSTPSGTMVLQVPGKDVQFSNGELVTDDPEVINHLENVYNDKRFPIISERLLRRG